MKTYILSDSKEAECAMSENELIEYCAAKGLNRIRFDVCYVYNDWNWIHQYADTFIVCGPSLDVCRNFVLRTYYHDHEYDGDHGVVFSNITVLG